MVEAFPVWNSPTVAPPIEPDNLSFTDLTGQPLAVTVTSEVVTLSGMTEYQYVFMDGNGEYRINGGSWESGFGTQSVTGGSSVQLRMVTSASLDTENTMTIRIANRKVDWTALTVETIPNLFVEDAPNTFEGDPAQFVISLAATATSDITFDWITVDGTALVADSDYTPVSPAQTATIPNGSIMVTLSVPTTEDISFETDENFYISISNASGGGVIIDDFGVGVVVNDDDEPYISVYDASTTEGGTLSFVISINLPSDLDATFDLTTVDQTATDGVDFTSPTQTSYTIPVGTSAITLAVATTVDSGYEADETFAVSIFNLNNAQVVSVPVDAVGIGTINNDDPPPKVYLADGYMSEGTTGLFLVTLDFASSLEVFFDYETVFNTATVLDFDYISTETASIPPGQIAFTLAVNTLTDAQIEGTETFYMSLSNAVQSELAVTMATGYIAEEFCNVGDLGSHCIINTSVTLSDGTLIAGDGTLEIVSGGELVTARQEIVTVDMGGDITISAGGRLLGNFQLEASNFDLVSGGTITGSGLGYRGGEATDEAGTGPGAGSAGDDGVGGGGAGHGGKGGDGGDGRIGGPEYGSMTYPTQMGSGGGASAGYDGGDGGGYLSVNVTGIANVDGIITHLGTNGFGTGGCCGEGAGGGSGGGVLIDAVTVSGSGTINVTGGVGYNGTGNNDGGSGAGGRIALLIDLATGEYTYDGVLEYGAGARTGESLAAEDGTFYTNAPVSSLICDSGDLDTLCVFSMGKEIDGAVTLAGAGSLSISPGVTITLTGDDPMTISLGGIFHLDGDWIGDIGSIEASLARLAGRLTGNVLDSNVTDFTLETGSTIMATGRGFRGGVGVSESGLGPGASNGSANDVGAGGAGHGGDGGRGGDSTNVGLEYGSLTYPTQLGSGGGAGYYFNGGNGGGAVVWKVAETATIDGSIFVSGTGGSGAGGCCDEASGAGSGGSILIDARTIAGGGHVESRGGNGYNATGNNDGGAGSGGRVALLIDLATGTYDYTGTYNVTRGNKAGEGLDADDGTFYTNAPLSSSICDNGDLNTLCEITTSKAIESNVLVTGTGSLSIATGVAVTITGTDPFTVSLGGDFYMDGNWLGDITYVEATTARFGGSFTGNILDSGFVEFTLESSSTIVATGRGFRGGVALSESGTGPGASAGQDNDRGSGGAGHGGTGGQGGDTTSVGAEYGTLTYPTQLGSGAGASYYRDGGDGGGAVILKASETAVIDGEIYANGTGGTGANGCCDEGSGGGSGGSILVDAKTINGTGHVEARGGSGYNATANNDGGPGAGGRIGFIIDTGSGSYNYIGSYDVNAGTRTGEALSAEVGTFYTNAPLSNSVCDAGDLDTLCEVTISKDIDSMVSLTGLGSLSIAAGVTIGISGADPFIIDIDGNMYMDGSWYGDIAYVEASTARFGGYFKGNILDSSLTEFELQPNRKPWSGHFPENRLRRATRGESSDYLRPQRSGRCQRWFYHSKLLWASDLFPFRGVSGTFGSQLQTTGHNPFLDPVKTKLDQDREYRGWHSALQDQIKAIQANTRHDGLTVTPGPNQTTQGGETDVHDRGRLDPGHDAGQRQGKIDFANLKGTGKPHCQGRLLVLLFDVLQAHERVADNREQAIQEQRNDRRKGPRADRTRPHPSRQWHDQYQQRQRGDCLKNPYQAEYQLLHHPGAAGDQPQRDPDQDRRHQRFANEVQVFDRSQPNRPGHARFGFLLVFDLKGLVQERVGDCPFGYSLRFFGLCIQRDHSLIGQRPRQPRQLTHQLWVFVCQLAAVEDHRIIARKELAIVGQHGQVQSCNLGIGRIDVDDVERAVDQLPVSDIVVQSTHSLGRHPVVLFERAPAISTVHKLVAETQFKLRMLQQIGNGVDSQSGGSRFQHSKGVRVVETQRLAGFDSLLAQGRSHLLVGLDLLIGQDLLADRARVFRIEVDLALQHRVEDQPRAAQLAKMGRLDPGVLRQSGQHLAQDDRLRKLLGADADRFGLA